MSYANYSGLKGGIKPKCIQRRRALMITAAAAGAPLLPWTNQSAMGAPIAPPPFSYRWRGNAFGTNANMILHGLNKTDAHSAFMQCKTEITRLEKIFSLKDKYSAISRLNKNSNISSPPKDFVHLLRICNALSDATEGSFDVTVQPLWNLYDRHFSALSKQSNGPAISALQSEVAKINYRSIDINARHIRFSQPGMMITLNGIAQGYITDRIVGILQDYGAENFFVDLGELRGMGRRSDNRPWNIGMIDPENPVRLKSKTELNNEAMASSGGYGTIFEPTGENHHLFNPFTGKSADFNKGVTVIARDTTTADALSTAISVMSLERAARLLSIKHHTRAIVHLNDHTSVELNGCPQKVLQSFCE